MLDITCWKSLGDIAEDWDRILSRCSNPNIFMTLEWQKSWWEALGGEEDILRLLHVVGPNGEEGIAPLVLKNDVVYFSGSPEVCDYSDFLVAGGSEDVFYPALIDYFVDQGWSNIKLESLPESSSALQYLPKIAESRGYSIKVDQYAVSPGIILPKTWDSYISVLGRKDRHELRRKIRRLDSLVDVASYAVTTVSEIESNMDTFLKLMRLSHQDKDIFLTPEKTHFFSTIVRELAAIGSAKLFFMESNNIKIASVLCFDFQNCRLLYNSGYNPEYSHYSVGILLKAFSIRDAIEEGKDYFDFLKGSEAYKYNMGGRNKLLYSMEISS